MRLQITINDDSLAMTDASEYELGIMLNNAIADIAAAMAIKTEDRGAFHDSNGNTVGTWRVLR